MKKWTTALMLLLVAALGSAQNVIYEKSDSARIERILTKVNSRQYSTPGERILDIASEFIGEEYVAATLENGKGEPLYISCTRLDCTTFVELVLAMATTSENHETSFSDVCRNLEKIRYRGGVRNGYTSRLHYASWWIEDNTRMGLLKEITFPRRSKRRILDLHFMSRNPEKYPLLKNDSKAVAAIAGFEKASNGKAIKYLPKEFLNGNAAQLNIKNGDIIMLVTTQKGLDIAHMGFAFWKNGKLHLMHASSLKKKVIKDELTLHEYQKNKKSQPGIRVLRVL